MSPTSDVTLGLAQHLHDHGVGVWAPDGIFASGQTGIVLKVMPQEPHRIVTLTPYPVNSPTTGNVTLGMQVRTRGLPHTPMDSDDLQDEVYHLLHAAEHLVLGGRVVQLAWRQSHAILGEDSSGRWEQTGNYYLHLTHASAHTR